VAHLVEKEFLFRANRALMLGVVGGGLAFCAVGGAIYDIGYWLGLW
jgi:hypothetical protein